MLVWVDAAHAGSQLWHLHAADGWNLKGMGNFIRFSPSIYFTHSHPFMWVLYIYNIKDWQLITAHLKFDVWSLLLLCYDSCWAGVTCRNGSLRWAPFDLNEFSWVFLTTENPTKNWQQANNFYHLYKAYSKHKVISKLQKIYNCSWNILI